jgi:PAS domain S-box-containing protein
MEKEKDRENKGSTMEGGEQMEKPDAVKTTDLLHFIAQGIIPVFIVIIAVLAILDIRVVSEPPLLLFILNTLFISVVSFVVAYISARNYLARGSLSFLLLGCGVLAFGSGNLVAGWLIGPPGGPNAAVTIHNIEALFGSVFHVVSAALAGVTSEKVSNHRKSKVILAYLGGLAFTTVLTIASIWGAIPPFFIQELGPTLLRQVVLGTAVALFGISSLLFRRLYSKSKEAFQYWYSLALALIAVGLSAVFLQKAVGSPIGWAGRSAQYLSGIYFLIAVLITYMEGRLRIGEEKLRSVFVSSPDAITVINLNGNIVECNQSALDIHGCSSKEEALGKNVLEFIAKKDHERATESLEKTLEQGSVKDIEYTFLTKDGCEFPAEFSASVIKDAYGNPTGFVVMTRDITERKRTEEAVRRSEEHFRSLIENASDVIAILNGDGTIRYVSPSIEPVLGYEPEDLIGKNAFELAHPDDAPDLINAFTHVIQNPGATPSLELRVRHKDGSWRILENTGNSLLDDSVVAGIVINSRDITERKRAEEALRESEERYRSLLEGIPVGLYRTTPEGQIIDINPALVQMLGYPDRQALLAVNITDVQALMEREGVVRNFEARLRRHDETIIWVRNSARAVRDGDSRVLYYEGSLEDITKRKVAEEEREQLLAELEAKNKELESFVYTVSHDLKAPLVSLDGFSSALQEEFHHQLGKEGKHYVERIQANVARMDALIMHLLDLSRIGRVVGSIEEIDVAALLREIQEELAVELEEAGAELVVQEPLPAVRADRSRMHQVFANLIDNALKFRSEERPLRIEVGCQEERGFYRFHVADNGIGIAPQYHQQIFTPFRQLDPEAQGVGMGLALVKKIVEHHGGRVWVESEEGEGATLYFTLPGSAELNRSAETSASLRTGPQAEGSVEPLNRSPKPNG